MITGKYKSYGELAAAFNSGELDPKLYVLQIDNDCAGLHYFGDDMNESDAYDHCESLFSENRPIDPVVLCNLLGIPSEGA